MRKQEDAKSHNREHDEYHLVGNQMAENHQRLIAEEVEEQPHHHHRDENDHRDRMPEEAEEHNPQYNQHVVHCEVDGVLLHTPKRVAEGFREGEAVEVEDFAPWARRREAVLDALLGA